MKSIQDDSRELLQIALFKLIRNGISGRGTYDAEDEKGNIYECKSCSGNAVMTSRDTNFNHIKKWRQQYWIISTWDRDNQKLKESYFLSPSNMENWILSVESILIERSDLMNKIKSLSKNSLTAHELNLFDICVKRALTLNAPSIPMKYVKANGTLISNREELDELVSKNPIDSSPKIMYSNLLRFIS